MIVTGKVKGGRQTSAALRELSRYVVVPLNATSRFALQPTLRQARINAKGLALEQSTGALAASLTIKRNPRSRKINPMHRVGPDAGFERQTKFGLRKPVKYAHLVEFGTAPHYLAERGVMHPGSRPHPFMTPAYHATKQEVVTRFGKKIGPEMEKRAAKLNRGKPR